LIDLQKALPGLEVSDEEEYQDDLYGRRNKKKVKFSKSGENDDFYESIENATNGKGSDHEEDDDLASDHDNDDSNVVLSDNQDSDVDENPLIQDLVNGNKSEKRKMNTNIWFNKVKITTKNNSIYYNYIFFSKKEAFDFLRDDGKEENSELLKYIEMEEKLSEFKSEKKANKKFKKPKFEEFQVENDNDDAITKSSKNLSKDNSKAGFEEVPQSI
jgi:hypothetical protein